MSSVDLIHLFDSITKGGKSMFRKRQQEFNKAIKELETVGEIYSIFVDSTALEKKLRKIFPRRNICYFSPQEMSERHLTESGYVSNSPSEETYALVGYKYLDK